MLIFSFCNIVKKIRKLALMGFEKVKKVAGRYSVKRLAKKDDLNV